MSQPTPPGGQDPLLSSLDALVQSGRLSPDSARAALVAAQGGGTDPAGGTPGAQAGSPAAAADLGTPVDAAEAKRRRMIVPFDAALIALGVAFLFAVVLIGGGLSRAGSLDLDPSAILGGAAPSGGDSGLDVSMWLLGLLAALLLVGAAVAGQLLGGTRAVSSTLVGWSGAFAALSLPFLLVVLFDLDGSGGGYLFGVLVAALAGGTYFLTRQAAPLFVTILGIFVVYVQLIDDIFDVGDGDHPFLLVALVVTIFVAAVTVAGLVVEPRGFAGAVVGWLAVVTFAGIMIGVAVAALVSVFTAGFSGEAPSDVPSYDVDIYITLVLAILLILGWSVCYLLTENVNYRLLTVVMTAVVVPGAILGLSIDTPSLWQVLLVLLGGAALGFAVLRTLQANPRAPRGGAHGSHGGPPAGAYGTPPAYGGQQGPPAYGTPQAPPAYGGQQTPPAYGSPQGPPPGMPPQGPPSGGDQTQVRPPD